jgi:hypothetical protein
LSLVCSISRPGLLTTTKRMKNFLRLIDALSSSQVAVSTKNSSFEFAC